MSSFAADLVVAAASDLVPAEPAMAAAYEAVSNDKIKWVNGSSGNLARQVQAGAPFDVFLSADISLAKNLESAGSTVPGTLRVYAEGRLGLYSKRWPGPTLELLKKPEIVHVAIANPAHAPYGRAAKQVLDRRKLLPEIGDKLVFGENVLQAYQMAATGNADVCLVAWSIVKEQGGVLIDAREHDAILQAGAVVGGSPNAPAGRRFLQFLVSPAGRAVLARYGFFQPK